MGACPRSLKEAASSSLVSLPSLLASAFWRRCQRSGGTSSLVRAPSLFLSAFLKRACPRFLKEAASSSLVSLPSLLASAFWRRCQRSGGTSSLVRAPSLFLSAVSKWEALASLLPPARTVAGTARTRLSAVAVTMRRLLLFMVVAFSFFVGSQFPGLAFCDQRDTHSHEQDVSQDSVSRLLGVNVQ